MHARVRPRVRELPKLPAMTVVDSSDRNRELVIELGPVERTADELRTHAEAVAERTRLLVVNETLGNSFGSRDNDAADSYRNTAEVFGAVADLLGAEMERGRSMLMSVVSEYRTVDADNAEAVAGAADVDETGVNR